MWSDGQRRFNGLARFEQEEKEENDDADHDENKMKKKTKMDEEVVHSL